MTPPQGGRQEFASSLRAFLPDGWHGKESMTLLAPDGQANVIFSSEPLDPTIDTAHYAEVQGDLLRREFAGYEERWSGRDSVFGGREGFRREFTWVPPDGVRVFQIQLYWVTPGRGYTATATALVADHPGARQALEALQIVTEGPPTQMSETVAHPDRTLPRPFTEGFPSPPRSGVTDSFTGTVLGSFTIPPPDESPPGGEPIPNRLPLSVVPASPSSVPPRIPDRMPDEAVPGHPPPLLPEPPGPRPAPRSLPIPAHDDPAAEVDKNSLLPWFPRLHHHGTRWTAATEMVVRAPDRAVPPEEATGDEEFVILDDGRYLLVGEAPLTCRVRRVRTPGLPPAPPDIPFLSRLRALHTELLDADLWPTSAGWYPIAGTEGVLDRLAPTPGGATTAFLLSSALGEDHGLVASGSAPIARSDALVKVAIPLSGLATVPEPGGAAVSWWRPPGWIHHERLLLSTPEAKATANLRPPDELRSAEQWRADLLREASVPGDMTAMVGRRAELDGFGPVTVERFDRQTTNGPRLASVVHGLGDAGAFGLILDVALDLDQAIGLDLDELLGDLQVR